MMLMEYRILQRKLLFIHHVANSGEKSLAREVLAIQAELNLPGIYQQCKMFLVRFGLENLTNFSKSQFKRKVKAEIRELNKIKLIEKVESAQYKKIDLNKFRNDDHNLKSYFKDLSVTDSRLRCKIIMTPRIKMNFQSDRIFTRNMWVCENCSSDSEFGVRDTQNHVLLFCPGLAHLREGKNLSEDRDLVDFFKAVIQLRSD